MDERTMLHSAYSFQPRTAQKIQEQGLSIVIGIMGYRYSLETSFLTE